MRKWEKHNKLSEKNEDCYRDDLHDIVIPNMICIQNSWKNTTN